MTKVEWEGNPDCIETRLKIYAMFKNFSPRMVDKTRKEIDPHLLNCQECRAFLKAKFEIEKKRGFGR